MSNLISLADIYRQKPVKQEDFNLTNKLLLYHKTGYIHLYISLKRGIRKILEYRGLPEVHQNYKKIEHSKKTGLSGNSGKS